MHRSPGAVGTVRRLGTLLALATVLFQPSSAGGQALDPPQEARIDSVFAEFEAPGSPGCAVGVIRSTESVFARGYGLADLEHRVPITPTAAFYAASVSKQFTAFAVALLAQRGELSLDDEVRRWIPEVPDFGPPLTVRHLIHHTSGLRDYFGLLSLTGWPFDGPLTERRFLELVSRQRALNFPPGERFLYSNTGYVLLAILVERVTGRSLRQFAEAEIFRPLGMTSTGFRDDHRALVRNRAPAYAPMVEENDAAASDGAASGADPAEVRWLLDVPGFDVVGDGGLYTTVEDMSRWAVQLRDWTVGGPELGALVLTRGRLSTGDSIPYAFGLSHARHRGASVVQHGGGYGGYRTFLLSYPEHDLVVVTLCNTATANPGVISRRVADVVLDGVLEPEPGPEEGPPLPAGAPGTQTVDLPLRVLETLEGAYWSAAAGSLVRVAVREGRLSVTVGGPWRPLMAHASDRFRTEDGAITLWFTEVDGAPGLRVSLAGDGPEPHRRMPEPRRQEEALAEVIGRYRSAELDVTWLIEWLPREEDDAAALAVRMPGLAPRPLEPVFEDAFLVQGALVRLNRDASGRVTGLTVSAGRIRDIRFERLTG